MHFPFTFFSSFCCDEKRDDGWREKSNSAKK